MRMAQELSMRRVIKAGGWPPYCCQSGFRKMSRKCPPIRRKRRLFCTTCYIAGYGATPLLLCCYANSGKMGSRRQKPRHSVNSWCASKAWFSKSSKTGKNVAFRSILRMVNGLIFRVAPGADGGELASPQRVGVGSRGIAVLVSTSATLSCDLLLNHAEKHSAHQGLANDMRL